MAFFPFLSRHWWGTTVRICTEDLYLGLHKTVISNTSLLYLQNYTTETTFANPCYPRNYTTTFTEAYVFGSLCTEDLRPESYDPNNIITFEGTGDPSLCREKVASLFNFSACHDREVCAFNGVYQPKVKRSFLVRAKLWKDSFFSPLNFSFSPFCFFLCWAVSHFLIQYPETSILYPILKPPYYIPFWELISFCTTSLQAFAGFYYTASAFNLSGSFSLHTFNSSTWNFCSQNWGKVSI